MYRITTKEIPQEIIDIYIPKNILFRERLLKQVNNSYQWNIKIFNEVKENNYSFIENILHLHLFNFY